MSYDKSFIEVQFPVSKISKESYKERKAGQSQTITGLGKWWGRKPLILVRSIILGLIMPASENPKKDREIYLKILSMDKEGLQRRKEKNIKIEDVYAKLKKSHKDCFEIEDSKVKYKASLSKEEIYTLQMCAFNSMTYDEKINYCSRPEHILNLDNKQWKEINEYLDTNAFNFNELVEQLSKKKIGKKPVIGDCFCGGGSVPYEAARFGCDVVASDLNPIAALLTWSSINISGASNNEIDELKKFIDRVLNKFQKEIDELGIEINEYGWRGNSYLYCNETICPVCGYKVPLVPSLIISNRSNIIAELRKVDKCKSFEIDILSGVSKNYMKANEEFATIKGNNMCCPNCLNKTPISSIRNDRKNSNGETIYGLRQWERLDMIASERDVFQERLYCIKYEENFYNENGKKIIQKHCIKPSELDLEREKKIEKILEDRFFEWQKKGYIPSALIENGYNTNQVIRERGWKYWNQLFNPRQLLSIGILAKIVDEESTTIKEKVIGLLGINKCANFNSKLSKWRTEREIPADTFYNQALNTLYNYGARGSEILKSTFAFYIFNYEFDKNLNYSITVQDARTCKDKVDYWITDPPYADAVNYHELSEFFLAWDKKMLLSIFPNWYNDSKRVLAVRGLGETFNTSMIEIYSNMTKNMSDDGMQVVMFTHQDAKVWAELSMILWSAGLQVVSAWNIATETDAGGLKDGNYVKGTVILILRKQTSNETVYLDELYSEIEEEVKYQIDSMRELDDKEDPNFSDPDYLLAAYAASLKILTSYKNIEDIDVKYELSKARNTNEVSPIENIINQAVKIAYDYLIPSDFDSFIWKSLIQDERLYLKGIELEKQNLYQLSAYQELARGFGVGDYTIMLASTKANTARLKTPKEFAMKNLNDSSDFGNSLLRNILVAIYLGLKEEDTSKGRNWLKTEMTDYWNKRNSIIEILNYLSKAEYIDNMEHWKECAHEAFMLKNLIENDNI